jgi:hypothetical protein
MAAFSYLGSKANNLLEQIDESVLRLVNFLSVQSQARRAAPPSPNFPR